MKLGICGDPACIAPAKAAGCDYIELSLGEVAGMSEEAFEATRQALQAAGLPCPALNCFIPARFGLCLPGLDRAALEGYLRLALGRARALGAGIVVFGSGRARRLPDGMAKPEGMALLAPFLRLAGDIAAGEGITIVIEPLRAGECNAVNTLRDGMELMELAGHPHVRLLADMYHMARNGEDFNDILLAGDKLLHCHIARTEGRMTPLPGDGCDYAPFFAALRAIGYRGMLSIECDGPEEEIPAAAAYLRELSAGL